MKERPTLHTVTDALLALEAHDAHGFTFLEYPDGEISHTFAELIARARATAGWLQSRGMNPGDRLALIIPDAHEFVVSFYGALLAGVVPVPLFPPFALGELQAYLEKTARLLQRAGARMVLTPKRIERILWPVTDTARSVEWIVALESVSRARPDGFDPVAVRPEDPAFIQFTSGSTQASRAVIVTHGNLVANCRAIVGEGLVLDPGGDRGLSWLPLYHDMGLIGFVIAPLFVPVSVVFMPTTMFLRRPLLWFEMVHQKRATVTFAPNFAYSLVTNRVTEAHLRKWDLSCLRVAGCGAEPISAQTLETFLERFSRAGLRADALVPSYGMAEATLSISFKPAGTPWRTDVVDGRIFREHGRAIPVERTLEDTIEFVSCGRWLSGHSVRILDEEGNILDERCVGEIVVAGPSVTPGYLDDEAATRATYRDGWLHTGDLGYLADGELYVSGRKKDLIIVHGRNYTPEAIEWVIGEIPGIRRGNVAVFSRPGPRGTEEVVVACEVRSNDYDSLRKAIQARVSDTFGLSVADIVFLAPRTLPKTTSGKIQRQRARQLYMEGSLAAQGPRGTGRSVPLSHLVALRMRAMVSRVRHSTRRVFHSGE